MERKVFRSRISVALIVFIIAIMLLPLILMIREGNIFNTKFYIPLGVIMFIVLLLSGFRYKIVDNHLSINTWGTCSTNIPLSQIVSIERTYNPLSSAAGSLKRLCVRFKKGYKFPFVLISPVREQEFLETLKTINPNIQINVTDKNDWWRIWDWDI